MTGTEATGRLLVFAREPDAGRVKTRLIPAFGAETAARLYRRLLADTLVTAATVPAVTCEVWIDQDRPGSGVARLAQTLGLPVIKQRGADLGQRMLQALLQALQDAPRAVLIGSDCPMFDRPYLDAAFAALTRHDAVIGPSTDGGYVLIGLRRTDRRLFENVPWGSERVLQITRERLRQIGWSWTELPALTDVDEPDDVMHFPRLAALVHAAAAGDHDPGPGDG